MNSEGKIVKEEFDPRLLTAAENTVKFPRYGRMKGVDIKLQIIQYKQFKQIKQIKKFYNIKTLYI